MISQILALEENPSRIDHLRLALESPKLNLTSFSGTYEIIKYAERHIVDLILCDVHLQNVSAFEFLASVRKIPKLVKIPFIFYCIEPSNLTKSFAKTILVAAKKLGARDVIFMDKYAGEELRRAIELHLPSYNEPKCA